MRFILFFGLALAAVASAKGHISSNVGSGSPLYDDLERLEAYGCALPTFRALRPQSFFDLHDAIPAVPPPKEGEDAPAASACAAPNWLLKERSILQMASLPIELTEDLFLTHDDFTPLLGTESTVTPLIPLRQGRPVFNGPNLYTELDLASQAGKDVGFAFGLTPGWVIGLNDYRNLNGRVYLQEGYVKVGYRRLELTLGRTSLGFGESKHGSLILSGAAKPLNLIKFSLRPHIIDLLSFLGPVTLEAWSAGEGDSQFIRNASLFGIQGGFRPARWLEISFVELFQYGGSGMPSLSAGDFFHMALYSGASELDAKRHRSFGLNLGIWGPSEWVKLYGQLFFDSLSTPSQWFSSEISTLVGLWFPKLGEWDFRLEYVNTQPGAYQSPIWKQGFVYAGTPLGHPLGPDAQGFYLDLGFPALDEWRPNLGGYYEARANHPPTGQATERRTGGGLALQKRWQQTQFALVGEYARVSNSLSSGAQTDLLAATATLRYLFF